MPIVDNGMLGDDSGKRRVLLGHQSFDTQVLPRANAQGASELTDN
jgi:hypothetical protein